MSVSVVIVTRGNVDLDPIIETDWPEPCHEIIVWNNGVREDLSVYGRYAAIEECHGDVILVQDDDVILPLESKRAIIDQWYESEAIIASEHGDPRDLVVCNMPAAFRHEFYEHHGLVGFGAAFHRDAPGRAFSRYWASTAQRRDAIMAGHVPSPLMRQAMEQAEDPAMWPAEFHRTCDIVFTGLTPRVLVDVAYTNREFASDPDRMWRQPTHQAERQRMLDLVLQVAHS